ncbi:hypothetical protein ELY21_00840 [Legionella sp. km535]|uniref:hypothetical protein n=1 Tax=Legionella sp. km535 TaxID=2498107 RepID=UPI000F8D0348|nr:hypothetical protein [Legionella sp. km535]RUR20664.1 hypothetical protein ELY21_00840 [Legionella sp. km535]
MHDKKVLERLIVLRQLEEQKKLEEQQLQELNQLMEKNSQLAKMSMLELQEALAKEKELPKADVSSKNIDPIVEDYNKQFSKEDWYREPKVENGRVTLAFPTKEAMTDFFHKQAELNRPFVVVDHATNKVMAFSKGDGTLYHGDGRPFVKGDELTPSGLDIEEYRKQQKGPTNLSPMSETVQDPGKGIDDAKLPSVPEKHAEHDDSQTLDDEKQSDMQLGT